MSPDTKIHRDHGMVPSTPHTERKGSQIGINTTIAVNTLKMKLSMCPLFGLVALLEMSYTQVSLQNWVGSNCNSNNLFGCKRSQILEVGDSTKGLARTNVITLTIELLETEDGQDEFGLKKRQIL